MIARTDSGRAVAIPEKSPPSPASARSGRRSLFRRYTFYLASLLSFALIASGGIGAWFAYQDARSLVDELQREKARNAALRIGQFIETVEQQMRAAAISGQTAQHADLEARQVALLKLLRLARPVGEAAWIDATGHERVRVSRLGRDAIGSDVDRAADPAVAAARQNGRWFGPIRFLRQSEPHIDMAVAGDRADDGMVVADINLKFASDVVTAIWLGENGRAYVVDAGGGLIAHPDAEEALRKANLADLPQVRAALDAAPGANAPAPTVVSKSANGTWMIAANASIDPPGWHVIVEQPVSAAFAPVIESMARAILLLLAGIALAVAASLVLARRMAAPIRALGDGAGRIGDGHLDERVEICTGDELEALAEQFNQMAHKLRESYAGLEIKVAQRTRELEEANRSKARFLAAASHDLRQPVHALGLFVAHLQEARDEDVRRRLIGKVAASSAAISELIEALLDISKLDAGVVAPQPAEFALQPLFDHMEQAFSIAARDNGLRLRIRPTRLRVRCDPVLLERIVLNLCSNAIRYTRQGGAILAARMRGPVVRIEVRDTGIGMTPDQQQRIFEEFYQGASAPDLESKGLGLGLAIVDRLTRLLDLPLQVRSIAGKGSVFALDVPLAADAASNALPPAQPLISTRFDGLPVLLIDDDAGAREATEGVLAEWGCRVRAAADAAEAVKLLDEGMRPRLIICDYRLGDDERGTDVVGRIRARLGDDVPAVIISADSTQELQSTAKAAGLHFLHKPLNAARLRALLIHVTGNPPVGPL